MSRWSLLSTVTVASATGSAGGHVPDAINVYRLNPDPARATIEVSFALR